MHLNKNKERMKTKYYDDISPSSWSISNVRLSSCSCRTTFEFTSLSSFILINGLPSSCHWTGTVKEWRRFNPWAHMEKKRKKVWYYETINQKESFNEWYRSSLQFILSVNLLPPPLHHLTQHFPLRQASKWILIYGETLSKKLNCRGKSWNAI